RPSGSLVFLYIYKLSCLLSIRERVQRIRLSSRLNCPEGKKLGPPDWSKPTQWNLNFQPVEAAER
ncbi:MAG: hypothetical protein ACRC8Y_25615, partial [Chroococcales cyanobacterium]